MLYVHDAPHDDHIIDHIEKSKLVFNLLFLICIYRFTSMQITCSDNLAFPVKQFHMSPLALVPVSASLL